MTNQTTEERNAAGGSPATTPGLTTPVKVSQFVNKNLPPVWKRIGRLERVGEGARIVFTLSGSDHTVYLTRRELARITGDRMPGDLVTIEETPSEIITSVIGKAFRSRTGRALMIRTPYYSGDLMVPWQSFQKAMEGKQAAAPVSILENNTGTLNPQQNRVASLSHGLEGCF